MNNEQRQIITESENILTRAVENKYGEGLNAEKNKDYIKAYHCYKICNSISTLNLHYTADMNRAVKLARVANSFKKFGEILESKKIRENVCVSSSGAVRQ